MKVTKEILEKIRELRIKNMTYKQIAQEFNLATSSIGYHLNERTKQSSKERACLRSRNLTPEQRKERYKKRYDYTKKYIMDRYRNDEEFRKKFIQYQIKSKKKRQAVWKNDSSRCNRCGKKKVNEKFKACESCRISKRIQAKNLKKRNENK